MRDLRYYVKCSPKSPRQSATNETSSEISSSEKDCKENEDEATKDDEKESDKNKNHEESCKMQTKSEESTKIDSVCSRHPKSHNKRHRKSKHRKPSDPAIKNITEMLNSSLSIISPNTSASSINAEEHISVVLESGKGSPILKRTLRSCDFEIPTCVSRNGKTELLTQNKEKIKSKSDFQKPDKRTEEIMNVVKTDKVAKKKSKHKDDSVKVPTNSMLDSSDSTELNLNSGNSDTKNVLFKPDTAKEKSTKHNNQHFTKKPSPKLKRNRKTKDKKVTEPESKKLSEKSVLEEIEITDLSNDEVENIAIESVAAEVTSVEIMESKTPKRKVNAFQFLMESRFKSIGQNSDGVEDCSNTPDYKEKKEKRQSRNAILQRLVESKCDTKRKRKEEEEKDVYINQQLEKRAKRLKKLLNASSDNIEKDIPPRKSSRRRKIRPVVFSDSESSRDSVLIAENHTQNENVIDQKAKSPNEIDKDKENKKCDENSIKKKTSSGQNDLLSFLGIANKFNKEKAEVAEEMCQKESTTEAEEVFEVLTESKLTTSKTKKGRKHSKLNIEQPKISIEENAALCFDDNKVHVQLEDKQNNTHKIDDSTNQSVNYNTENSCSQETGVSNIDPPFTPDIKKRKKKKPHIEDHMITLKSPRTWKMRIRLVSESETESQDNIVAESSRKVENNQDYAVDDTPKKNAVEITLLSDDEDSESIEKAKQADKPMKVAPVFLKATPKPKIDPKIAEARKQFLMSGIPNRLKKDMEKQISMEDIEFDVFPAVSHIQQKTQTNKFWEMTDPQLKLTEVSPLKRTIKNLIYKSITTKDVSAIKNIADEPPNRVPICKQFIEQVKLENPNYPVYKSFKCIYEKSGLMKKIEDTKPEKLSKKKAAKRGRKKKSTKLDDSVEIIEDPTTKPDFNPTDYAMWTDKYKPSVSSDIIGNTTAVQQLKKWLEKWVEINDDINSKKKRKRTYSSGSEFEYTEGDSKDSICSNQLKLKNTVILRGPHGCGKSTAIYAVCNELGMNVLELNASSKRTGKRLLQDLQEATQSHQVHKDELNSLSQFMKRDKQNENKKEKRTENSQGEDQQSSQKKICVLLVEDVDIVFEQDEGFLSALSQLIATSKRPVILTTTNGTSQNIQKFISQHTVISFTALTAYCLSTWLQILCLVEGVAVDRHSIGVLLEKNNGDIRRTMLQLQFWVQTGGDLRKSKNGSMFNVSRIEHKRISCDEKFTEDITSHTLAMDVSSSGEKLEFQTGCLDTFEIIACTKAYNIPLSLNASKIWWNLPNIISLNRFKLTENQHSQGDNPPKEPLSGSNSDSGVDLGNSQKDKYFKKNELQPMYDIYDSLLLTDLTLGQSECMVDLEPCPRQWDSKLLDSLELNQRLEEYNGSNDLAKEISHTLTDGYIGIFKKLTNHVATIDLGVPSAHHKRWRTKQHECEDLLQDALSLSCFVDRRAVSVDFMPVLRNIARSEMIRAANNTKRGNRFNNYLRGLGVDTKENSFNMICNVLKLDKFK